MKSFCASCIFNRELKGTWYSNKCLRYFITYVLGRKSEASPLSRQHVCKIISETVNALDNGKRAHAELHKK